MPFPGLMVVALAVVHATAVCPPDAACLTLEGERRVHGRWETDAAPGGLFVSQSAEVAWPAPAGGARARPELILRCAKGEKEAYLYAPQGFASREGEIFVRFDDEKPRRYWGAPSRDGRSLFLTGFWSRGTDGFVTALLTHRQLTMTVRPKRKPALPVITFELAGLDEALVEWRAACPLKR